MMSEVITRRLNEAKEGNPKFSKLPDLMLIDGGKGQLNAAREAAIAAGYPRLQMIGLAKQFELIFVPGRPDPIVLPKNSMALMLAPSAYEMKFIVFRLRIIGLFEERMQSCRFSDEISGVGPTRKKALFQHFGSVDLLRKATIEELEPSTADEPESCLGCL